MVSTSAADYATLSAMYSRLFRRETGRRLLAVSDQVVDVYLLRRFTWMNAFSRPDRAGIHDYLCVLADAVAHDDTQRYFEYSVAQLHGLLDSGTAPIALLAAGDLLQETILEFLTPDQRELVWDIVAAERQQRQQVLLDLIQSLGERGA